MILRPNYFLGVDPAPAFGQKNDDGALVVGKAWPKLGRLETATANPADWHFGYVWAYKLRGATIDEWSGFIHKKHREFSFTKMVVDVGAGGGGGYLMAQLRKGYQMIEQVTTQVRPIVTTDETTVYDGYAILHMLRRADPGVKQVWPLLDGDDMLVDAYHTAYRQAVEGARMAYPAPFDEVPREISEKWSKEAAWASKLLVQVTEQLQSVQVATYPGGGWQLTSRGAKQFSAIGKKDMAYAAIFAYIAFLIWLTTGDFTPRDPEDDGFVAC